MSGTANITRLVALLHIFFLLSEPALTSVSCPEVVAKVIPCVDYVIGRSDDPSNKCCAGVKQLWELGKNKADKQAECECLKKKLGSIKYDPNRITQLPPKCHLDFTLPPITANYDCSKVPDVSSNLAT